VSIYFTLIVEIICFIFILHHLSLLNSEYSHIVTSIFPVAQIRTQCSCYLRDMGTTFDTV